MIRATPPAVGFLARLKAQTRREHAAIEGTLGLTDPALTLAAYRQRVAQFYGYFKPLEARFAARGAPDWPIDLAPRRKLALLDADLRSLGLDAVMLPLCTRLPACDTLAGGLGCLYVLEGSTLGGQVIGMHLRSTLGIGPDTGARYFHGYGEQTAAMWKSLRAAVSAFAGDCPATQEAVIASANSTFRSLRHWCRGIAE